MKTIECKNPDCHETRMLNHKTGTYLTYCEKHQREYWRDHSKAKNPGKNAAKQQPALIGSIGDNGTAIETANTQTVAKTLRLSEADKQRIFDESRARVKAAREAKEAAAPARAEYTDARFKDTYTDEDKKKISEALRALPNPFLSHATHTEAIQESCESCNDCFYQDVVELLEKRVPGVREMVSGLKTIHGQK